MQNIRSKTNELVRPICLEHNLSQICYILYLEPFTCTEQYLEVRARLQKCRHDFIFLLIIQ